jgi:aldehyde dehydrogenase (NAD+)
MNRLEMYIYGEWVSAAGRTTIPVINPATEELIGHVAAGDAADIDRAVKAARRAFAEFSECSVDERICILERIAEGYEARADELGEILSLEMGAPRDLARTAQVSTGLVHLRTMIEVLKTFPFTTSSRGTLISREPVGVCALITPWNWPFNQIVCKVAPALAAGCTMVLKPSEIAPFSAILFAEIVEKAGVPPGVFNLVNGDGPTAGEALASHPDVDMVSFTGSTRAGIEVARVAARTVKRVHQELGGKSANIILSSANFRDAAMRGAEACFRNTGQSCNAPTRMIVPKDKLGLVVEGALAAVEHSRVGPPHEDGVTIGPLVSQTQFDKVSALIEAGIEEGAELIAGGPGRAPGFERGYYVRPTVFAQVRPEMRIAREEIFGPVLTILTYDGEEEAVKIANDTVYGLAAYVQGADEAAVERVARQLRVGTVYANYPTWDPTSPFGGYKQSGNGREYGAHGLEAFLEVKGVVGSPAAAAIARHGSAREHRQC